MIKEKTPQDQEHTENLKLIFRKYGLLDNIIYVDVTEEYEKDNFLNEINEVLGLKDFKITEVPTIIYFKEGKPSAIVKTTNGMIDSWSLEEIIQNNTNVD